MANSPEQREPKHIDDPLFLPMRELAINLPMPTKDMQQFKQEDFGTYMNLIMGLVRETLAGTDLDAIINQAKYGPELSKKTKMRLKFPGYLSQAGIEQVVQAVYDKVTDPEQNWGS